MSKEKYILYCHTNKQNEKKYVGITKRSLTQRAGTDGIGYKGCPKFYNAIQKYGWDNFSHQIIEKNLSEQEALEKEVQLIWELRTNDDRFGYNMKDWIDDIPGFSSSKPVTAYDLELNIIGEYPTINSAARELNLSPTSICDMLNREKLIVSEIIICYSDELPPTIEEVQIELENKLDRIKKAIISAQKNSSIVIQQQCCKIDITTKKVVEIYVSITDAAKKNKITNDRVSLDCKKTLIHANKVAASPIIFQYYPDIRIPVGQIEWLSDFSYSAGWLTLNFNSIVRKLRASKDDVDLTILTYWVENKSPLKLQQKQPGSITMIDDTGYVLTI